MANKEIDGLDVITPLIGTERVEIQNDADGSGRTTTQAIANLTAASGGNFPVQPGQKERSPAEWFRIIGVGTHAYDVDPTANVDNTTLIQAAIDASYAAGYKRTEMPRGRFFKTTDTIYVDPPGNLRATGADAAYNSGTTYASGAVVAYDGLAWTSLQNGNLNHTPAHNSAWWVNRASDFQFSMSLVGEGLPSTTVPASAHLRPTFGDKPVIVIGPGQACEARGIGVWGQGTQAEGGVGIAIAGGSSGASNTLISDCYVLNMHTAYQTGHNEDALADSNTFFRCDGAGNAVGFYFPRTQNYIIDLVACRQSAKVGVKSPVGKDTRVHGGNFSNGSCDRKEITVSAVSAPTRYVKARLGAEYWAYKMDWTLASTPTGASSGRFFDTFVAETTLFGAVPLIRADDPDVDNDSTEADSWNAGTNKLTLALVPTWVSHNFNLNNNDLTTLTTLFTELQTCTKLYAVDKNITFWGTGMKVYGNHIENANAMTTLLKSHATFDGGTYAVLSDLYFNYEAALGDNWFNTTGDNRAWWLCQQVHPFIDIHNGNVSLEKCDFGQSNVTNRLCIDVNVSRNLFARELNGTLAGPNVRIWAAAPTTSDTATFTQMVGYGRWEDGNPFLPHGMDTNDEDVSWHVGGAGRNVPFVGYMPKKGEILQLTPNQYRKVSTVVIAAANNGSGLVRLTVNDATHLTTGDVVTVQDVVGATGTNGTHTITKIDSTTIDLQGSTFGGTWTSGGTVFLQPGAYVPIYGKCDYRVDRWDGTGAFPALLRSNHEFLSYGQNLVGSWEHKGVSPCIYMSTALLDLMRQGLKIRPKNASGRERWFVVNGIYKIPRGAFAGYVTVTRVSDNAEQLYTEGDKATTYTGTEIEQERYSFSSVYLQDHSVPVITVPSTLSHMEGTKLVVPLTATSGITGETFTWSLPSGPADTAQFEIDNDAKILRWSLNGTRSFSAPADAGANNVYNFTLRATGDITGMTMDKAIALTVGDYNAAATRDIVIDTDLYADCDDMGALGVAMQLDDAGSINLMGVICSYTGNTSGPTARATLNHYGFTGVPVGTNRATVPAPVTNVYTDEVSARFGVNGQLLRTDFLTDVQTWRMVLATAPRKVYAVTIGGHMSIMKLLNSVPDNISPLSGPELIAEKVDTLYVMGGDYPSGTETNMTLYPSGSDELARRWPTPVVWHGVDIGQGVLTGPPNTRDPLLDPIRHAYVEFGVDEQSSWDPFAMLHACLGDSTNFDMDGDGANGTNVVNPNTGANAYTAATGGNDNVATKVETNANLRTAVNALLSTLTAP
jgi:hypothetical protein